MVSTFHEHNGTEIFGPWQNINVYIIMEPCLADWMHWMIIMDKAENLHLSSVEHLSQ